MNAYRPDILPIPAEPAPLPVRFATVDTWVFDLDNTLYPPDSNLWPQIDERITAFIMEHAGLDGMGARALQKHYYKRHGTTLKALMEEGHVEPRDFLEFVHDIDRTGLLPDDRLKAAIAALPGRRLILTNGSRKHAEETAAALGLLELFHGIHDIEAADYLPKPEPETYWRFFDRHGVEPRRAAMFEDLAKNLKAPFESGMRTVLVVPRRGEGDHREAWERDQGQPPFVEYVTEDLPAFLEALR